MSKGTTHLHITKLTTNCTEHRPSGEADSDSGGQEIPSLLRNAVFHVHVHNSPSLVPISSQC